MAVASEASANAAPRAPAPTNRTWEERPSRDVEAQVVQGFEKQPRFIDEILVDRTEACVNEPITFTVKARDHREKPRPLTLRVDTEDGSPGIFIGHIPGERDVLVDALDGEGGIDRRRVRVVIRRCPGFQFLEVTREQIAGTESNFRFVAKPYFNRPECIDDGGLVDRKCESTVERDDRLTYAWSLGDGARVTSEEGYLEHDYIDRPQREETSSFVVEVEAQSRKYGTLRGVVGVAVPNGNYRTKMARGVLSPLIIAGRATREGGSFSAPLTVRNPDPATLRIASASLYLAPCTEGEGKTFEVAASRLLGRVDFPSGKTETTFTLDRELASASYCQFIVDLKGTASDGSGVEARFGGNHQTPNGAHELHAGGDGGDDAQIERFVKAARLLGRDPGQPGVTVSAEEIRSLQLRGLLK